MKKFKIYCLILLIFPSIITAANNSPDALIILDTPDVASMNKAKKHINENGGRIMHVFPTHVFIGYVPEDKAAQLVGSSGIKNIYFTRVDLSITAGYEPAAKYAVDLWNNSLTPAVQAMALAPQVTAIVPILNDCIILDRSSLREGEISRRGSNSRIMSLPYGAGTYDTSSYMIGSIAIGVIFPESTGVSSTENWDTTRESVVLGKIYDAMNWFIAREPRANLSFTYEVTLGRTDVKAQTAYEPVNVSTSNVGLWIGQIMGQFGYNEFFTSNRVFHYDNDLRNKYDTSWAYTVFVADSLNDPDGAFPGGEMFAYSYLGGPCVVMTYDNNSFGIDHMDAVCAHESCHIFWALDEYSGASSVSEYSGYLDVQNGNHMDGGITNDCCTMRGYFGAFASGCVCGYTKGQLGWSDTNSNNILDAIDAPPTSYFMTSVSNPTNQTSVNYFGNTSVNIVPNNNPSLVSSGNDITVNTIKNVQYRIDYGSWINARSVDGTFEEINEDFVFTVSNVGDGSHSIQVQAEDSANNRELFPTNKTLIVNTTWQPPAPILQVPYVYPNPCKLNSANRHVTFKNLPDKAKIKIYTVTGELVFESQEVSSEYKWAFANNDNQTVATEAYIYVVLERSKEVKKGKLIIIR